MEADIRHRWESLHTQKRFLPRYPSEEVIRFAFTRFSHDPEARGRTSILDLGCGGGRHSAFLAREGFLVTATDISRTGVEQTGARLAQEGLKAETTVADMREIPFPDESFDGVIAYGTLYYGDFAGMKRGVEEIRRVLRKGAPCLVVTRTRSDCRYDKGSVIVPDEPRSILLNKDDTNEGGMTMTFLDEADVRDLFGAFGSVDVDLVEATLNNRRIFNSDWVITAVK